MRRTFAFAALPLLAAFGALTGVGLRAVGAPPAPLVRPGDAATFRPATGIVPPATPGGLAPAIAPNKLPAALALERVRAERDAYFLNAQRENYRSVREVLAQRDDEQDRGLRFSKLYHGDTARRQIALTFDDGPHPQFTPQILSILKRENVKATFFVVGSQAERYPELVRAEEVDGHLLANHTYHHVSLIKIPQEYVADEIKACGLVLKAVTGRAPRFFRPPGGEYDTDVAEASQALGYTMVLWTDDPGDYASPGKDVILKRTIDKASNGGIILIHDGIKQTVDVLPTLIERLKAEGYEFVTIDEMAPRGGRRPGLPVREAAARPRQG
jgi:peptidoglycan/xylan/chitin deacetylase (PgdA/CDA1 family)